MDRKTRILIVLTVAVTSITIAVVGVKLHAQDAKDIAAARHMGVDPAKWLLVTHFTQDRVNDRDFSQSDWDSVVALYHDKDPFLRTESFHMMSEMRKSLYRSQIIDLAKRECSTPNAPDKATALLLLWKFGDPSWRTEATALAADSDYEVRYDAHFVLQKGDV